MKTLEQIKNEYAKSKGYDDFDEAIYLAHIATLKYMFNELLILVQKECLKNASDNAEVDKESITNENNIIK